jgi:endonuclease/exonuclease/phosphatase family metal-dependent hydrolase
LSYANGSPRPRGRIGVALVCGLVAALCIALLPGAAEAKGKGKKVGHTLTAMSRNLYLGADLTPALTAGSLPAAINAGGQIVNQVHATKFPSVRAAEIAAEIKKKKPDVVGLQEGAWWRTGPLDFSAVNSPKATTTDPEGGDFLTDLLTQLNSGGKKASLAKKKGNPLRYRIAVVKNEFDQELPVNDGNGGPPSHNERLTMRDAILVRNGVKVTGPSSGTFNTLLHVMVGGPSGIPINVTRGWVAANVKVHGRTVHLIDTHLEAFDSQSSNLGSDGQTYPKGGIREAQAKQLMQQQPSGAVLPSKPNILIGDLNSDFPVNGDQVSPGDALAYQAVLAGGFAERSPAVPPFGCCIEDPNLANPSTAGITHRVDHIMSNSRKVKFKKGGLTTTYANGLWSSDHFGLWSQLLIK